MRVPFLDLRAQYNELAPELDATVHEILSTGAYVVGKHNKGLEEEIAALHGVKHGIAVNSGTDALRIGLEAVGVRPGDEVITTAFTFVASVEAILQVGAVPKFVDIEPASFAIDPAKIEAAVTSRTKAIMPIHLFGQLADVEAISAVAERHGLIVLEDAAQAILSEHKGRYAGQFGAAAGVSFYVTKNLGAAGDGGMVLTDSDEVDEYSRSLRIHGMGRERYYYDHIGYTSRMAELQAGVLRVKLTKLAEWTRRRQEVAAIYAEAMQAEGVTLPRTLPSNNHTWHQFTIRHPKRDALQAHLKEREIDSMVYYPVPLHYHAPYRNLGYAQGDLPETERAALEVLSLPVHQHMTDEQARFVAACVVEFAESKAAAS